MSSPAFKFPKIPDLLKLLNVRLSPHKSQHFMHNYAVCEQIAEAGKPTPKHWVLEVGTGLGNLTAALAQRSGQVYSVEMDESFRPWHEQLQGKLPNIHVEYADFLTLDLQEIVPRDRPITFISNLPYQITAPVLFKLMESNLPWEQIALVIQLEVAERITAGPGTRRATALTYKLAYEYDSQILKKIGPQEFIPPPRVQSALLQLIPKSSVPFRDAEHRTRVHALVSGVFQHRRRTLVNALLLGGLSLPKDAILAALQKVGISEQARPETLGLEDFLALESALYS